MQFKIQNTKNIPILFHNGSTYDYHFIINKLPKEFYGELECFGENTEKYITFSVSISRALDNAKNITYRFKVYWWLSTSLSSLDDNLSEKPHSDKCKDCKSELDYLSIKNNQLVFLSVKRMIRKTIKN